MQKNDRKQRIAELRLLIRKQPVGEHKRILAENCDDPTMIETVVALELKRRRKIHRLSLLLLSNPRDQWERVLSEQSQDDPEVLADAKEEARYVAEGDAAKNLSPEQWRRFLESEEEDDMDE